MSRRRSNENRQTKCGNRGGGQFCTNKAGWIVATYTILASQTAGVRDRVKFYEKNLCREHFIRYAEQMLGDAVIPFHRLPLRGE